jgi:hypothetical protein
MDKSITSSSLVLFPNYLGNYVDQKLRDYHKEYIGLNLINRLYYTGVDFIDNYFVNDVKIVIDEFQIKANK